MNVPTSSGRPVRWLISAIGVMSATVVRAAQLARTFSLASTISRASRSTSPTTCGPAPGRPMSAVSMPSLSIRWRISIFCVDGRRPHRRRLQSVAQRLVVEHHPRAASPARRSCSSRKSGIRAFNGPGDRSVGTVPSAFARPASISQRRSPRCRQRRSRASHAAACCAASRTMGRKPSSMVSSRQPLLVPDAPATGRTRGRRRARSSRT